MVYAILTAVFFFLALTNVGGPQGRFCSLAPLCAAAGLKKPPSKATTTELPTRTASEEGLETPKGMIEA